MTTLPPNHQFGRPVVHKTCTTRSDHFPAIGYKAVRIGLAPILAALIVGCAAKNTTPVHQATESAVVVGNAGGRIMARAGFIEGHADQILKVEIGTPVETVKPQVESIRVESVKIQSDQVDADKANTAERIAYQKQISGLGADILIYKIEAAQLNARWYVRIGKYIDGWIKFAAIAIPIAWIGSGILAIFLPTWLPATGLVWSKAIVRFMPFMNWASWIRDRRAKK